MKNRTNTKKLLALGMATIFALTTAGCGTQDNSGATGSAADQTVGSQSAERREQRQLYKDCVFLLDDGPDPG